MNEESLGKRIARLRSEVGWTQQTLADRLAISRVAVSHLEMDLSVPSERTITLLAGLFKMPPPALVEATLYPLAKAERLPLVSCSYTEIEVQLACLRTDLAWLERLQNCTGWQAWASEVHHTWQARLAAHAANENDPTEKALLETARRELTAFFSV